MRLRPQRFLPYFVPFFLLLAASLILVFVFKLQTFDPLVSINSKLTTDNQSLQDQLAQLQGQDQYQINQQLQEKLKNSQKSFETALSIYESIIDLKDAGLSTKSANTKFAKVLSLLSKQDYQSANDLLSQIQTDLAEAQKHQAQKQLATLESQAQSNPALASNTPPSAGFQKQLVKTSIGDYAISLVAAEYSSTKVIVDTASDNTCSNDCPVLSLADYVARNGAYAGINGSYFCPASYPSCAGKTNSFDLLLMNKNKTYFNSDNNVYSTNPGVIFGGSYIRFVGSVSQWGRDTSIDSMLSNYPLLVSGGQNVFGGTSDPKLGSRGNRSFVGNKNNTVYIGVVHNATVGEAATVLQTLGLENALNLDSGGSTALWSGGYKLGPGRNIPNAILFIRR